MQKISSYIYKNRIQVVSDTGYLPMEWKIVYQRTVKIYKGIDNVIEFDIRNGDQRRLNISNLNMKMAVMDSLNERVCIVDVIPVPNTKGLASCTIPSSSLLSICPQRLTYSVYIENNDGTKSPIYGDTQYGMIGKIQLFGGALPESLPPVIINTFYFTPDDSVTPIIHHYFSEAAEINPPNDYVSEQKIVLDFIIDNLDADITVQITDYAVISTATEWTTIERFSVVPTTTRVNKTYNHIIDYSNNVGWLRVKYTPNNGSTGKIKQITINL